MNGTKPLSPKDVILFYERKLDEDRLTLLMQAIEAENPKVRRWMKLLDLGEPEVLGPDDAATSSLRELIGSRMQSLSKAALWSFSANPFPALLAGEPSVRVELFGKLAGRDQKFDAMFERIAGSDREFLLRIAGLPIELEPLHLALADFDLGTERSATPRELFEPSWPVIRPARDEDEAARPSSVMPSRTLAARSHAGLALDGFKVRPTNEAESDAFWLMLEKNSSRLQVQADRRGQSRLDVMLLEVGEEQDGRTFMTKHAVLLDRLILGEKEALETEFDLPQPATDPPPKTMTVLARALGSNELCELSPFQAETLLGHRRFAAPTLTRTDHGFRFRLLEADVEAIQQHPADQCALRVALPEMEVR